MHLAQTLRFIIIGSLICLAVLSASCESEEPSKPVGKESSRSFEEIMQGMKWEEVGPEFKTALQEYIKQNYLEWEIQGEMIQFSKRGFYVVVVDITANKQRQSVTVISRMFRKADGSFYWKCEPFTPEIKSLQELIEKTAGRSDTQNQ